MNATIPVTHWQVALSRPGEVVTGADDINQCIAVILLTPQGSDPLRPLFGSDCWRYIDAPVNVATPMIMQAALEALAWEPRITVKSITPQIDGAHITLVIKYETADGVLAETGVPIR